MYSSNKSQGFALIETIVVVVIVGLVGFVGWYIWQSKDTKSKTTDNNSQTQASQKQDFTSKYLGVSITFKDTDIFPEETRDTIMHRIVEPLVFYQKNVLKTNPKTVELKEAPDRMSSDDSRFVINDDLGGSSFGYNQKIEYWIPQLCDDGGCTPYPDALKKAYPDSYQAYLACEADRDKNVGEIAFACMQL